MVKAALLRCIHNRLENLFESRAVSHPPPPKGICVTFHSTGGGGVPLDPLRSKSAETLRSGNFFSDPKKFFSASAAHSECVFIVPCVPDVHCSADSHGPALIICVFRSPVQPLPCMKGKDIVDALLCLRFKDKLTGRKLQEAYNMHKKHVPHCF